MIATMLPSRLALTLVAILAGCATTVPHETIVLDPLVLRRGDGGKVEVADAKRMFEAASAAYEAGRYDAAAGMFKEVADLFPTTAYAAHAHFNGALALQRLKRWEDAAAELRLARKAMSGTADIRDVLYQLSRCYDHLERWRPLVKVSKELLKSPALSVQDRVEGRARLGVAYYRLGRLAEAEREILTALEDHRQNLSVPSLKQNVYVAHAQYVIGAIYQDLFTLIKFKLPVESMRRDLTDKSNFFVKSQNAYLACIRLNEAEWSVAAGFQLGKLYEDFYEDMMAAEVPPELDESDKKEYFEELKRHVKPLVVRAIDVYERNLGMSDRFGRATEWTQKTVMRLERMRDVLRADFKDTPD